MEHSFAPPLTEHLLAVDMQRARDLSGDRDPLRAYLYVIVRPAGFYEPSLEQAIVSVPAALDQKLQEVRAATSAIDGAYDPNLARLAPFSQASGSSIALARAALEGSYSRGLIIQATGSGKIYLACGRAGEVHNGAFVVLRDLIDGLAQQAFLFGGLVYRSAALDDAVDVAVNVEGLQGKTVAPYRGARQGSGVDQGTDYFCFDRVGIDELATPDAAARLATRLLHNLVDL